MKKIISMLMICAMLMSSMAFAADFKDVSVNHDNFDAINTLATLEIIEGVGNGKYNPEEVLTRAELCTMLVKAIYKDDIHYNATSFDDVKLTHWACEYIETAVRNDLMVGYGDHKFGPDDDLTYTQTARTILNALGYGDLAWPAGVDKVAAELGLYDDIDAKDFADGCTRAEAAQMIYNAFGLKAVKYNAGERFETRVKFLEDMLGFKEVEEKIDGHIYVAYEDEDDEIYTTNILKTYEDAIYVGDNQNQYKLENTTRAKTYDFDWDDVEMYVNGVLYETGRLAWFDDKYDMVGIFDEDDELVAIYVDNPGEIFVPGMGYPNDIAEDIADDKNYNEKTSTITYFIEDATYKISNKIVCGFVTKRTDKTVTINNVKYNLDEDHFYDKDDFVVIYFDINNDIAGHATFAINEVYKYDTTDMMLHTWDCETYMENENDARWMTYDEVKANVKDLLNRNEDEIEFDICKSCHANSAKTYLRYFHYEPVVEPDYYTVDGWNFYHTADCSYIVNTTKTVNTVKADCGLAAHDCIPQ